MIDFVAIDGNLWALKGDSKGRFRLMHLLSDGTWANGGRWVVPDRFGFEFIRWTALAGGTGGVVVAGYGRLASPRGEMQDVPVFAFAAGPRGPFTVDADPGRSDGGWVSDLAVVNGTFVAVGQAQNEEVGWAPGLWASSDGGTWTPAEAPAETLGVVYRVLRADSSPTRVVAVGQNNRSQDPPFVLTTEDGVHWQAIALGPLLSDEHVELAGVAFDGSQWSAVGVSHRPERWGTDAVWESVIPARWDRLPPRPEVFGDGSLRFSVVASGPASIVAAGEGTTRSNPLYCYEDPATCNLSFDAIWLTLGGTWHRLKAPGDPGSRFLQVAFDGQRLVVEAALGDQVTIWTWLSGDAGIDGLFAPAFDTSAPQVDLPQVPASGTVEPGITYAYPLDLGCWGGNVLGEINGSWWVTEDFPPIDPGWPISRGGATPSATTSPPMIALYGTIRLVAEDRIEYSVPGFGVVAAYTPADPSFSPWGCL